MRKALIGLGVLAAVLLAAVLALLLFFDVNQFRPQIEAQLRKGLDRPVTLGAIRIKVLPPSLRVESVTIGEAESFRTSRPFITSKEIQLRAGLLALLRKQVRIDSLVLESPSIELIKSAQGVWNYASLGGGASPPAGSRDRKVALQQVEIVNGQVAITNQETGAPRAVFDHIDLKLRGFAPGEKYEVEMFMKLPGKGEQTVSLQGAGGPVEPGGVTQSDFDGRLALKGVSLARFLKFLSSDVSTSGEMALQVRERVLSTRGSLALSSGGVITANLSAGPMEAGVTGSGQIQNVLAPLSGLNKPLAIRNAAFRIRKDTATVEDLECSLGGSTLRGEITVRDFSSPRIEFRADIDQLNAGELQQLVAAGEGRAASSQGPGGLRKLKGGGTLSIGVIRYNNVVLNRVRATTTVEDGVIRLAPVTSELSGGVQSGAITIDTRPAHPAIAVSTKLERVDANQLLSATTMLRGVLYGTLAGETDARFVAKPGDEVARTLNGEARIGLTDGKLEGVNLLNEMAVLGRFLGRLTRSETFTTVVRMAGALRITDGVAQTDDLRLEVGGGAVVVAGTVNLVDQSLNLWLTTVLSRDLSERAGGKSIGGFLSTVLANEQGELVIPALVTGTLSRPRFAADPERFAQMKLKKLLPRIGTLGAGGGKAEPTETKEKRPLESILELLRKKK